MAAKNSLSSYPRGAVLMAVMLPVIFCLLLSVPRTTLGAAPDVLSAVEPGGPSFVNTEYAVFGQAASGASLLQADGGGAIGGVRTVDDGGPSNLGRKVKAGFLSLLLPGAGQYYNGDIKKAYIFVGIEAAVWASYLTFHISGQNREDTYQEYAGIYAGADGNQNDKYWQSLGRYMDSDAYNETISREARATGEQPSGLIVPDDAWQWRNEDHLQVYQELRKDANRAFDRRDFMTLFAIVNRAAAVFDAVRHSVDKKLSGKVLGFDVAVEVTPSLQNLRTECVISRNF